MKKDHTITATWNAVHVDGQSFVDEKVGDSNVCRYGPVPVDKIESLIDERKQYLNDFVQRFMKIRVADLERIHG